MLSTYTGAAIKFIIDGIMAHFVLSAMLQPQSHVNVLSPNGSWTLFFLFEQTSICAYLVELTHKYVCECTYVYVRMYVYSYHFIIFSKYVCTTHVLLIKTWYMCMYTIFLHTYSST
jgi:hypothetical protein